MADFSRRMFLVGGGAFVALAAAPLVLSQEPPLLSTLTLSKQFPYRAVHEITFCFLPTPEEVARNALGVIDMRTAADAEVSIFRQPMGLQSFIRWVAMPGNEIEITEERGLVMTAQPSIVKAAMTMTYNVVPPDITDPFKRKRFFIEEVSFNGASNALGATPLPLDPRDTDYVPGKRGWLSRLHRGLTHGDWDNG
jgi:hypothetical protein